MATLTFVPPTNSKATTYTDAELLQIMQDYVDKHGSMPASSSGGYWKGPESDKIPGYWQYHRAFGE